MSFLINPFISFPGSSFSNVDSMKFVYPGGSFPFTTADALYINAKTNVIDTEIRDTTPTFSFSVWLKPATDRYLGDSGVFFSKYNNDTAKDRCLQAYQRANGILGIWGYYDGTNVGCNIETTGKYSANTWVHFTFIYDSTQSTAANIAKIYINGTEAAVTNTTDTTHKYWTNTTTEANRGYVALGVRYDPAAGNQQPWNGGLMDEFTFWNKVLTPTEVTELYNAGKSLSISGHSAYANCIAWYRMGDDPRDAWDGSKWTIKNIAGNSTSDLISANLTQSDLTTDAP
jgi:hypothetical protein